MLLEEKQKSELTIKEKFLISKVNKLHKYQRLEILKYKEALIKAEDIKTIEITPKRCMTTNLIPDEQFCSHGPLIGKYLSQIKTIQTIETTN